MPKRRGGVHKENFGFTDYENGVKKYSLDLPKPKSPNNKPSQSYISRLWNLLPTLPRAKPKETIGFIHTPAEIYDGMKYCCTAMYNFLTTTKSEVINVRKPQNNSSSADGYSRNKNISNQSCNIQGKPKPRPRDWMSARENSYHFR